MEDEAIMNIAVGPNKNAIPSTPSAGSGKGEDVVRRKHDITPISHLISERGRISSKVGTRGSLATTNILEALPEEAKTKSQELAEKFLRVFQNPVDYIAYLQSPEFAADLTAVCEDGKCGRFSLLPDLGM
jgi:hypothetical protein